MARLKNYCTNIFDINTGEMVLSLQVELIYLAVGQAEVNKIKTQARRSRRDTSAADLQNVQTSRHRRRRRQAAGAGGADAQMYTVVITRAYSMEPTSMHDLSLFVRMENARRDLRQRLLLGGLRTDTGWRAANARYGIYSFRENLIGCIYGLRVSVLVLSWRDLRRIFEQYNRNALFLDYCPLGTCLSLLFIVCFCDAVKIKYNSDTHTCNWINWIIL